MLTIDWWLCSVFNILCQSFSPNIFCIEPSERTRQGRRRSFPWRVGITLVWYSPSMAIDGKKLPQVLKGLKTAISDDLFHRFI
jgi:hypothetical protein